MKNIFNFLSKKESTTETNMIEEITTISNTPIIKAKRERKIWDGTSRVKHIYNNEELAKLLLDTLLESLKSQNKNNYIHYVSREYDIKTERHSSYQGVMYINSHSIKHYICDKFNINEKNYINIINTLSKNRKKRLNKHITRLKADLQNANKLSRLLNFIELLGKNKFTISFSNRIENEISEKRKAYKDIIKYIKMDLPEELRKAREEYKEVKGDYFKNK